MKINDLPSAKILRDIDNLISFQINKENKKINKNEEEKIIMKIRIIIKI